MDKLLNAVKDFAAIKRYMEAINQMTDDFMVLVKSRPVIEKVIKEEKLDLTYEEMVGKVIVSNPTNTQIIYPDSAFINCMILKI